MVDDSALNQALDLRRSFILQNFESLTMKRLRDTLETDLKVESGSLKDYKKYISDYVDKLLANSLHCVGKEQGGKLDERKTVGSTRVSTNRVSGKFGDTVNKLRSVCRAATVAIPPCIYAQNKSEEELISALKTLLSKYGLRASSSAADISKVRAKLQLERDLDGIDVANILDRKGSRRSQQVNYRAMIEDQSLDRLEQGEANENSIKKKTGTLSSPKSKLTHNASTKFEDDEENNNTSLNLASKASINIGRKVTEEVDGAFTFKAEKVKRPRLQEWSDDD